jgi:hypothetical protein
MSDPNAKRTARRVDTNIAVIGAPSKGGGNLTTNRRARNTRMRKQCRRETG